MNVHPPEQNDKKENAPSMTEEEIHRVLAEFSRVSVLVAKMLQDGVQLSHVDRLTVENNIAVVQLNYTYWVRKVGSQLRSV